MVKIKKMIACLRTVAQSDEIKQWRKKTIEINCFHLITCEAGLLIFP